ncbi:MAG: hypothetical protein AAFP02_12855, partial [Bacteroidota bacterium]
RRTLDFQDPSAGAQDDESREYQATLSPSLMVILSASRSIFDRKSVPRSGKPPKNLLSLTRMRSLSGEKSLFPSILRSS